MPHPSLAPLTEQFLYTYGFSFLYRRKLFPAFSFAATSWGEEGYVYLEYSKNTCGLANEAIIPTIAASDSAAVEARMQRMRKLAWSA